MQKTILIFDDDEDILLFCNIIFGKLNYHVVTRNVCDHIVEDIIEVNPSIILMDLRIPRIGGEKAISLLKANPETNHVPVILVSANSETQQIASKVQATGFLKKPFDIADLLYIVEKNILLET